MDTRTGAIAEFETAEDAKAAGFTEPLTKKEAAVLRAMPNRHERRAELARMRAEGRAPKKRRLKP